MSGRTGGGIGKGLDAFRNSGFGAYWGVLVATGFAIQIQTVAVGWQVYDRTRDPLNLGFVGLSQFLPALLLVVVTGAVSDRYSRRAVIGICLSVLALASVGLMTLTARGVPQVGFVFAVIAVSGAARAFYNPARQSLVANLVPAGQLGNAIAVIASTNQIATICGPVAGGLLYGIHPLAAYGSSFGLFLIAGLLVTRIPKPQQRSSKVGASWEALGAGFRYIWRHKIVLGAISLDLFAVLLGGATGLLPVYARDILDVGPAGLGFLRAAPAMGAIGMGFVLLASPVRDNAGRTMFLAVAVFAVATIAFAVSETLWLSVAALAVAGAADMVSINIRSTLIQLWTPDDLRGRVNAVNQVFIGASNELGAFRAGATAAAVGPVTAVLVGGLGTLAVVAVWLHAFPQLARVRRLHES